jgi:hypothetical protein
MSGPEEFCWRSCEIDTIIGDVRRNARRVYPASATFPVCTCATCPIPKGSWARGVLGFGPLPSASAYAAAMKAEGVPSRSRRFGRPAGGSRNRQKVTFTRDGHRSFGSAASYSYGKELSTHADILSRFAGVMIGPKYTESDTKDAVAATQGVPDNKR